MADVTYNQLSIQIRWTGHPGTHGAMGTYAVTVLNMRMPRWWSRPWRLFSIDRPQHQSAVEEMKWAIEELHARMHGTSDEVSDTGWVFDDGALMELIG